MKRRFAFAIVALSAAFSGACSSAGAGLAINDLELPGDRDADAAFRNGDGAETGAVAFSEGPRGLLIRVDVKGLSEGWHAMHLHEVGDCSDGAEGFKASGGHINPHGREHGLLNPDGEELADIPNIYAGPDGRATAEIYRAGVSLRGRSGGGERHPIVDEDGFAVVIHENADDHMTQPIGGAGDRVACAALRKGKRP